MRIMQEQAVTMKLVKIYVDEVPEKCPGCIFVQSIYGQYTEYECGVLNVGIIEHIFNDTRHQNCPLKLMPQILLKLTLDK
jgi:hypothetical protein